MSLNQDYSHYQRKLEHLEIALKQKVDCKGMTTGLEKYCFIHRATPEIDLSSVDLSIKLFGKRLLAPVLISPMVGGIPEAAQINRNLATAAQKLGLAMGVGSERCLVDTPDLAHTYRVRDVAPDILLFANLGAIQLNYGYGVEECLKLVHLIEADGLILHLNPLQEALQEGGNTGFAGLLARIKTICEELPVPVVVKEVGYGISEEVARKLKGAGVSGIDVSGAGGTSWSEIETRRARDELLKRTGEFFRGWGIPTAESLLMVQKGAPGLPVIASGGIRNGIEIAKAIALGADAAGIAGPLLKAAVKSDSAVVDYLVTVIQTLKTAMFCIGAASIRELKHTPYLQKLQGE